MVCVFAAQQYPVCDDQRHPVKIASKVTRLITQTEKTRKESSRTSNKMASNLSRWLLLVEEEDGIVWGKEKEGMEEA